MSARLRAAVPTGAGTLTFLLATVLAMIGLRGANPWLLLVGCALFAPLLISQVLRPDLASVSVCFRGPDRLAVGARAGQVLHAHNRGRRSSPPLRLTHLHQGFEPVTVVVPALPPGGWAEVELSRLAVRRCVSAQHVLQLRTTAPFGMAQHRSDRHTASALVLVHPAPGPAASLPVAAQRDLAAARPVRNGYEPHELREWRPGDGMRQVHWRATARRDRLTVVVPEEPVGPRFALVILAVPDDDTWEELLSTAAWTAVDAVRSGGEVLLSATGRPDCWSEDPGAVLDWFAALPTSSGAGQHGGSRDGAPGNPRRSAGRRLEGAGPLVSGAGELLAAAAARVGGSTPVVAAVGRLEDWTGAWARSAPPVAGIAVLVPAGRILVPPVGVPAPTGPPPGLAGREHVPQAWGTVA